MRYTSFKFGLVPTIFLWLIGILMALFILRAIFTSYTEGFKPLLTGDSSRMAIDQRPFQMWPDLADQLTTLYNPVEKARQRTQEIIANLHIEDLGSIQSKIDKLKAAKES